MSSEAKRIKICILIELVLGLGLVVYGAVMTFTAAMTGLGAAILCADGVVSLVFGVRGALIANVPARMGKLATFALVVLALQVACVVGVVYMTGIDKVGEEPLPVVLTALPVCLSLVVFILSRGMAKRAER